MLLSGHGKPGGSTARLSEVGTTAAVRSAAVAARNPSGGSGAAGGSASAVGQSLGGAVGARWRPRVEESRARGAARSLMPGRSAAHRAWVETGTAGTGLRNQFVDLVAGGRSDRAGMRGQVPPLASLANSAATGMELPTSCRTSAGARPRQDPAV